MTPTPITVAELNNYIKDKFQNDELQNILISANKEITLKIDERKKKIKDEQVKMNKLVQKASITKQKLVKLTAEKKAIQLKLDYILDKCDAKINIEMNKNCESLNVGVATGIILFYLK